MPKPVNVSKVKDPKWSGRDKEIAVLVSRGEPRRTNEQMVRAVVGQVERYLLGYVDEFDGTNLDMVERAVELIAKDYIHPVGSGRVWLQREHLLLFVRAAAGES